MRIEIVIEFLFLEGLKLQQLQHVTTDFEQINTLLPFILLAF